MSEVLFSKGRYLQNMENTCSISRTTGPILTKFGTKRMLVIGIHGIKIEDQALFQGRMIAKWRKYIDLLSRINELFSQVSDVAHRSLVLYWC